MNTTPLSCTSGTVMANGACLVVLTVQVGSTRSLIFVKFLRVSCFVFVFYFFIIITIILSKLKALQALRRNKSILCQRFDTHDRIFMDSQ